MTLAATAAANATFAGWSGGCTGTGTCSVTMNQARTVTATFNASGVTRGLERRYLAEGATGTFFDTRIAIANPGGQAAHATLRFLRADGTTVPYPLVVPALAARSVNVDLVEGMQDTAFATIVESDAPVVVDRTMTWNTTGYGSHAESAVDGPGLRWYLAEGATHGNFELFYLIENPSTSAATVQVRYLRPDAEPLVKTYTIGPLSRFTVWVDREEFPEGSGNRALAGTDVSAVIESTNSISVIVERAMYLNGSGRTFDAGHESAGIKTPATRWFLAEGATGPFFDLFILIANPDSSTAQVRATFLLPNGSRVERTYAVGGNRRFNIWVDQEAAELADTALSTVVESTNGVPIVVERSMWWPGSAASWREAHNAFGATSTGARWAVADGAIGAPPDSVVTYLLVANTSGHDGAAKVTLLFEDGTPAVSRTFDLLANSRFNVSVRDEFPEASGKRFGTLIESQGTPAAQLVVERAMYSDAGGVVWAAGSNAVATPLP